MILSEEFRSFVSKCDRCQKSCVNKVQKGSEDFHPISMPYNVRNHVWNNIMTVKQVDGLKYLIATMDYFSESIEIYASKMKLVKEYICSFWRCNLQMWNSSSYNQVKEFRNAINDELLKRIHCKQSIMISYHPKSNGLVARQKRTSTNFLLKYGLSSVPYPNNDGKQTVLSSANTVLTASLLGRKPLLSPNMLLKTMNTLWKSYKMKWLIQ